MTPVLLYADDESADVFFMELAFRDKSPGVTVAAVASGKEAIAYLAGTGRYGDRGAFPPPFAVILDINMPLVSGFTALQWIRAVPAFRSLPVYMFSSSDRPEDRAKAVAMGANGYMIKPINAAELAGVVETVLKHLPARDSTAPSGQGEDPERVP